MNRRIIGIGSPFGADQLGWRAIDLLKAEDLPGCELIKLDRPGSDLIRHFDAAEAIVLIDAIQADRVPGNMRRLDQTDLLAHSCLTSSHGIGVAEALELARQLDLLPEHLQLIGIEAGKDLNLIPGIDKVQLLSLI